MSPRLPLAKVSNGSENLRSTKSAVIGLGRSSVLEMQCGVGCGPRIRVETTALSWYNVSLSGPLLGRSHLAAEQQTPEGPRVELGVATEKELCSPGAVKLIHIELTELKAAHRTALSELQTERNRSEGLTFRAHSSEVQCGILRERLGSTGHRDLVVRLIELGILGLLAFAIDFARSGSWTSLGVSILLSLILGVAIFLIQRGQRAEEGK
jgi:hypothetical protein